MASSEGTPPACARLRVIGAMNRRLRVSKPPMRPGLSRVTALIPKLYLKNSPSPPHPPYPPHPPWSKLPAMATVSLTVNGAPHTVDVDPATPLLYVLRNDLNLQGPRFGCG